AAHAFAIAQAMLRLFATPKIRPTFPARTFSAITPSPYPPFASGKPPRCALPVFIAAAITSPGSRISAPAFCAIVSWSVSALLLRHKCHGILRVLPSQLQDSAAGRIFFNRDGELVDRLVHRVLFHLNPRQVLLFIILRSPLARLFVDDQLCRAVFFRLGEERVGSRGN